MKLAKLSLAAIVVAGLASSSFAADSLAAAFKEGKVSGAIKSMYRDVSVDNDPSKTGFAVYGELGYVTGSLNGFSFGATFQTSHTLGLQDNVAAEVDGSVATSQTSLSESYLAYQCDVTKSTIKIGRQYIDTPLVSSSSSRLYNDMFEGATIANTYFANTTLVAGVVKKYKDRFNPTATLEDEIYTAYVNNKSIKGLELTAQMTYHKDDRTLVYVDAAYALPTAFPLTVGAQYIGDYSDVVGEDDAYIYGFMAGTEVAGFGLSAYYNRTSDERDVVYGYGQGTDWTYNSVQYASGVYQDMKSYQGKISYDFSKVGVAGLTAFVRYATYDSGVVGNNLDEWNVDVSYKFSGAAKGLEARVRFADIDYDAPTGDDGQDFRVIAAYKF